MTLSLNQQLIVDAAEVLPLAVARDFTLFLTGEDKRYKAVEYNLPVLVDKKILMRERYGRSGFVYKLKGKGGIQEAKIRHDLISTDALLRFKLSKEGIFYGERFFHQNSIYPIPEWAVLYNDVLFLFEFSTADNFKRADLMRKKVERYVAARDSMRSYFNIVPVTILVIDAPVSRVEKFAKKYDFDQFYYTEFTSFLSAGEGEQLEIPVYIWGGNGERYPLYK